MAMSISANTKGGDYLTLTALRSIAASRCSIPSIPTNGFLGPRYATPGAWCKMPPELVNVSFLSRVRDGERCAGKPYAPFIEGLVSREAGLLYQKRIHWWVF